MTKEEIIQEAYGDLYDKIYTDKDGWAVKSLIPFLEVKDIEFKGNLNRPKSLQGIESNNGWIEVNEDGTIDYNGDLFGYRNGDIILYTEYEFIEKGWLSHYQPIVKPQPPIYLNLL